MDKTLPFDRLGGEGTLVKTVVFPLGESDDALKLALAAAQSTLNVVFSKYMTNPADYAIAVELIRFKEPNND